jgi:hypothetical protein
VALMWGQDTANHYSSSVEASDFTADQTVGEKNEIKSDHSKAFRGCVELLERAHIQFDVIDEVSVLQNELEKYELLIMPTVACLREGVSEKIERFVQNGGNLISTFDTGFYHKDGTLCEVPQLGTLQGIEGIQRFLKYATPGTSYLRPAAEGPYSEGVNARLAGYQYAIDVKAAPDAKILFESNEKMRGRYDAYPKTWFPAAIEKNFGKGKSIYFTGDVGDAFLAFSHPDMQRIFVNTVNALSSPLVQTDAPGSVEMVLRKCQEGYALHLINFTGEMMHPISRVLELSDIRVTLFLSDIKGEVKSATGTDPIDVIKAEGSISFTIPKTKIYEVITIR